MSLIPFVIEKTAAGERSYDLFSRLLRDRIIFINGPISTEMSHVIVAQLLHLESDNSEKEIAVYLNSPGGEVTAGMAIYDAMQFIKPQIATYAMGQVCSMGSLLAQAGAAGKRYMLPNARHMIHQVSSGSQGTAMDMEIAMAETLRLNNSLTQIYVDHNTKGKTFAQMKKDMSRDFYMTAQDSVDYGLADIIVAKR